MQQEKNVIIKSLVSNTDLRVPLAGKMPWKGKRGFLNKVPFFTTLLPVYGVLPPQGGQLTARGFTLIELLVVVLIIGILAAVAIPQYKKAVKKAHYAKMLPVLMQVVDAEKLFYLQNGSYTVYLNQLDALPFEIKNESCPAFGRRIEDYCVELHSYGTDKCLSVTFPYGKFGLTDEQAWNSGYIYCFEPLAKDNSGVGHVIPHGGPWCWEEGYWPPRKERSDFHCTGELIHHNFHGAWFYI